MSTLVRLTKMVDLAVGSPEPGAVNFNILHSLLHVIIQQSHLQNTEVEFRGDDAYRVQSFLDAAPPFPSLKLSEYTIFGDMPGSAPTSRPATTNKKRDERSRRPEDDRKHDRVRPKDSEHDEVMMTVVDHAADSAARGHQDPRDKKVVSSAKSGPLVVPTKAVRKDSVTSVEAQVEAKRKGDDRPPRDRDERPRGKEDKPRDREERPREKEDRPRDKEERPRGKEDKPRDREERPREKEDRPRDRDEKPRDKEERGKDSRRDDARQDEDRGKSSRRVEPEKSRPQADIAQKSTTVVVVEHYDQEETEEKPAHHQQQSKPVDKSKSSILKKTASGLQQQSTTSYQKLLRTVSELQTEVATLAEFQMPTNDELLESVRSKSTVAPIAEMWELIKLTKRMDGAETGINKLSTMIEDLAGESAMNREAAGSVTKLAQLSDEGAERIKSLEKRLWEVENRMGTAERRLSSDGQGLSSPLTKRPGSASSGQSSPRGSTAQRDQKVSEAGPGSASSSSSTPAPGKAGSQPVSAKSSAATSAKGAAAEKGGKPETAKVVEKVSSHKDGKSGGAASLGGGSVEMVKTPSGNLVKGARSHQGSVEHRAPIDLSGLTPEQIFELLKNEINALRRDVDDQKYDIKGVTQIADQLITTGPGLSENELRAAVAQMLGVDVDNVAHMPMQRIGELEQRVNTSALQIHSVDQNCANQLETLQRQMNDMEKELGTILERINSERAGGESGNQDFTGLGELYTKITLLQTDIDNVTNTSARLMDEREERQLHINALLEQIEVLKTVKADKEDLEDMLADKADHNLMNRKVSHDQFDAACDDLSRGLEEALAKLTQQEMLWQQALDDVQREIENKLDKIEISPLKDFVNSKLKLLQERLKALAALRKETEAAGTKHKLLRNVNCISCDKDAVMKMEEKGHVASEPLPATRSMKPYLTYELDAVRKQQRRLPGSRNMNHFESAMTKDRDKSKEKKRHMETTSADHLCNRYCGGSHTITTPQQRVTRMGHFLAEYGPEAIPLRKAQRPRALSIADKTAMSKGTGLPAAARLMQLAKLASLGDSPPMSPAGSPRTSGARPSSGSVEVIKPPKHSSLASKAGSIASAKPTTPTNGLTPPESGTPTKEATPPREGTPPTDEAPPPADDGGVIDEEAPSTEPAEEGGDIPEDGAAPEEDDAPPPAEDEAPAVEEAEPETAEPPADIPEAEPEPEAAPEPEPAPEDTETAEEPPPEE